MRMVASVIGGAFGLVALTAAPATAQSSPSPFTSATRYDAERRVTGMISPHLPPFRATTDAKFHVNTKAESYTNSHTYAGSGWGAS